MTSLPYCLYRSSLPPGSLRRISIGVFMIFLTMVLMFAFVAVFPGREDLVWSLFAIPVAMIFLANKWMKSGSQRGVDVLRFDEGSRNFEFCSGREVTAFRAEEARFIKKENGENHFEVRSKIFTFPVRVYSAGNFRTAFVLSSAESLFLAFAQRFNSNRVFSYVVDFEGGVLTVWGETLAGEKVR